MPKEVVHSAWGQSGDVVAAHVEVGWSKEGGYVQLASIGPGQLPLPPEAPSNGWFADLDRAGCNRLIRAIRKARDQAFGADA
jgi:hypothetical protein